MHHQLTVAHDAPTAIDAGWTDAELTGSSAVVAPNLVTNSFDHLVGTELDLPAAPSL